MHPSMLRIALLILLFGVTLQAESPRRLPDPAFLELAIPELLEARRAFEETLGEVQAPVTQLQTQYEEGLSRLAQTAQAEGNLEKTLLIRSELEGFRQAKDGIPSSYDAYDDLKWYRKTYLENLARFKKQQAKARVQVYEVYIDQLAEQKTKLTQDGRLDEAAVILGEIHRLQSVQVAQLSTHDSPLKPRVDETVAWELEDASDYKILGELEVTQSGKRIQVTSPQTRARLESDVAVSPPFRLVVRAGTDTTNVRFYYGAGIFIIFNWEENKQTLWTLDPVTASKRVRHPGEGYLEEGKLHDIEIEFTEDDFTVRVNGEERVEREGDFESLKAPVGIGPCFGSVVSLEDFRVYVPSR